MQLSHAISLLVVIKIYCATRAREWMRGGRAREKSKPFIWIYDGRSSVCVGSLLHHFPRFVSLAPAMGNARERLDFVSLHCFAFQRDFPLRQINYSRLTKVRRRILSSERIRLNRRDEPIFRSGFDHSDEKVIYFNYSSPKTTEPASKSVSVAAASLD